MLSAASQAVPGAGRWLMKEPAFSRGSAVHTWLKLSIVPCQALISWPRYYVCRGKDEESLLRLRLGKIQIRGWGVGLDWT